MWYYIKHNCGKAFKVKIVDWYLVSYESVDPSLAVFSRAPYLENHYIQLTEEKLYQFSIWRLTDDNNSRKIQGRCFVGK